MKNDPLKTSYTWNKEYCLPYESKWSRIIKFCYLNGYTNSYINSKKELKTELFKDIVFPWYYGRTEFILSETEQQELKICPICMKYGYHSYLHQVKGECNCFLHHTKLKTIPMRSIVLSETATYDMLRIDIERIVKNEKLKELITNYTLRAADNKVIYATFHVLQKDANGGIRYYRSTQQLFESLCLSFESCTPYGYACIRSIRYEDIENENKRVFYSIIDTYAKQYQPSRSKNIISYAECMNGGADLEEIYLNKHTTAKYLLNTDTSAGCLQKIVSDIVDTNFNSIDEWYNVSKELCNVCLKENLQKNNLDKYPIIMAIQAILGYDDANNVWYENSYRWKRYAKSVRYRLDVFDESFDVINHIRIPGYSKFRFAPQFIIYPILTDLIHYLIGQAEKLLFNGYVKISADMHTLYEPEIWNAPQYAVVYYANHVEIYKCYSDNTDINKME